MSLSADPALLEALPARSGFAAAAERVTRRLLVADWLRSLERISFPVAVTLCLVWFFLRVGGVRDQAWWAVASIVFWLAIPAILAWLRRPSPFAALAHWDRAAGAREMLASAWWFERSGGREPGAILHLERAGAVLAQRADTLGHDLPLPKAKWAWLILLFATLAFSGWLRPGVAVEDRGLSDDARARASAVGKELAEKTKVLDPLKSLTEEEQKKLKGLRAELQQTAAGLDKKETPRDLLQDLERRARDAEKLADELKGDEGGLSPGFLSELERNADTADLGNALRSGDLGAAAEQAKLLSARLGSRKPTLEEQKRLEEALKRALEAASKKDRDSATGQELGNAQQQLSQGNSAGAAQSLGSLGRRLGAAAQRKQAQQQLRNLAQNFRGGGQRILGGQNLQRLMPPGPSGSMPLGSGQLAPGQGLPNSPLGMMPSPGSSNAPLSQIPIPGTGQPRGGSSFPMPGSGQNPGSGGMPAPIPGTSPGSGNGAGFPVPGMGGVPGAGMAGAGSGGQGAGVGGSQAGNGTAPLGADPTTPLAATGTGTVAPTTSADGPSDRRAVEGDSHREQAGRSAKEIATDFLKAEEAALADEPLPLARREQVLRYFTALRESFEKGK